MKSFLKTTFAALVICALASIVAAAGKDKVRAETVKFASDIMVNGTLVKAGSYQIKFNEQTGELSILKDGKVKAKTTAQLQARNEKARDTAVKTLDKGGVAELIGFSFGGSKQDLIVGAGSGAVSGNN
jgi:hypothetical protein